jgi:hypothetical protein
MKLKFTAAGTNFADEEQVKKLLDEYKEQFLELRKQISELRKEQKNPIIPDGVSRNIPAKIQYAQSSGNKEDFEQIESLLEQTEKEIEDCSKETSIDLPGEVEESFKKIQEAETKEVSDGAVQEEEKG